MKQILILLLFFLFQNGFGQVLLDADGPGNTYELITSVLAPGHNPIEVPDCNHLAFGDHIDEVFDNELGANVFRFHIHTSPDNDRCINLDRQRNEIKTYDQSPDNLLGEENEKVVYKWKFKLDQGFQSSPNFTHLHQLKSVGGSLDGIPMYTLTTRKGSPDKLELRYAETDDQVTLTKVDLLPFIDTWLDVTETITYGISGTYDIEIKRLSDNMPLLSYSNPSIINWRPGATFVRPKWGIYRSLINAQDLRDESILYANFSIEEIETTSSVDLKKDNEVIFPNPIVGTLYIKELPNKIHHIQMFSLDAVQVLSEDIYPNNEVNIDVSSLASGVYILNLIGEGITISKKVCIF